MITDTQIKEDELKTNIAEILNAMSKLDLLKICIGTCSSYEYVMLNVSEILATNEGIIIQAGDKVDERNVDAVAPLISKWLDDWRVRKFTPVSDKFCKLDIGYIYEPQTYRVLTDTNAKDGTRIINTTHVFTYDLKGNEGFSLFANRMGLVFWGDKCPSSNSLIEVPIHELTCHCENDTVDFETNGDYIIEPHTVNIVFPTLQIADEFSHLAVTEGGSNFLLRTVSGRCIEVLFLETELV